jgi:type IV pilus assembly protein PilX
MKKIDRYSTPTNSHHHRNLPPNERGMVLIIAMIMVLLMTIIGLAAIRGSGLQEMMAGNMRDMQLRFQAAESGASAGEMSVRFELMDEQLDKFKGATKGLHPNLNIAPGTPVFEWDTAAWAANAIETAGDFGQLPAAPFYAVEQILVPVGLESTSTGSALDHSSLDIQPEGQVYRTSSRYSDDTSSGRVLIQTLYKR